MAGITTSLLQYPSSAGVARMLGRPRAVSANQPKACGTALGCLPGTDAIATVDTEQLSTGARSDLSGKPHERSIALAAVSAQRPAYDLDPLADSS